MNKEKKEVEIEINDETLDEVEEKDNEIRERINKLYGLSSSEPIKRPELSEEEKKKTRKQMVFLIWFCLIMSGLIIINIINPITELFSKEEPVTEKKEPLADLPSGDVAIENAEIQAMINMFKFDINNPLYEANITKLFSESKELSQMDFNLQMFLLTSNEDFNNYLYKNTKLKDYNPTSEQNLNITIKVAELNNIVKEIFGEEIELDYQNFKYYYNFGTNGIQYFDVVINEDKSVYTFNPIEKITPSKISVYTKPVFASNIDNEIYIRYNVVFVSDNGIYSDANLTKLLSNDVTKINEVVEKGFVFEKLYKRLIDDKNIKVKYYFKNITVIETYG